jgi:REP element-mobilizing transposase RayT
MRKENPARFSSAVGEAWMHCEFKIKYCHAIFDDEIYRESLRTLLIEAAYNAEIPLGEIGFDNNHVHFMADICNYSRPQVAKILKGYTGKKFFEFFPELKRQKHEGGLFWKSGLWNPSYYIGSPRNLNNTINYIKKQKYGEKGIGKNQTTLVCFAA